jgi:hypothetical protein
MLLKIKQKLMILKNKLTRYKILKEGLLTNNSFLIKFIT